jgi:tetrapyrrole methylase family protein/MazG family protein
MSASVARLREIVERLRGPDGCPWDREQTHQSLRSALIEECYEAIHAIEQADDTNLREELGDLLLLVVMHAQMGAERGAFHFEEIAHGVCEKLIRRHPHVFGEVHAGDSREVLRQWEQIKREEKGGNASVLEGVPSSFPALLSAQNVQKKVARVGFDWPDAEGAFTKLREELSEFEQECKSGDQKAREEEAGDLLFAMVNVLRKKGIDAESALAAATRKFTRRFQAIEAELEKSGRKAEECSLAELDQWWDQAKAREKQEPQ